jgi:hypothetical protein
MIIRGQAFMCDSTGVTCVTSAFIITQQSFLTLTLTSSLNFRNEVDNSRYYHDLLIVKSAKALWDAWQPGTLDS